MKLPDYLIKIHGKILNQIGPCLSVISLSQGEFLTGKFTVLLINEILLNFGED